VTPVSAGGLVELEVQAFDAAARGSGLAQDLGAQRWAAILGLLRASAADGASKAGFAMQSPRLASVAAAPPTLTAVGEGAVSIGMAFGMVSAGMDGSLPDSGSVPLDVPPREIVEGNQRTVGRVTGTITFATVGSRIAATVDLQVQTETFDIATGASLGMGTFRTTGTVELDFCPDDGGSVRGQSSLVVEARGSAGAYRSTADGEITATVGNDAFLQSAVGSFGASDSLTAPDGTTTSTTVEASGSYAFGPRGSLDGMTVTSDTGQYTDTAGASQSTIERIGKRASSAGGIVLGLIAAKAQDKWRGGACLEIRSSEPGRDVRSNELVQFKASLHHKFEGRELDKPIFTTFAGTRSVDPVDIEVPAPVDLSFKAGPRENDRGTVHLKSTSNRGIAELDVSFRVKGGWKIDQANTFGHIQGLKCGDPPGQWIVDGTYDQQGMHGVQRWTITIVPNPGSTTSPYANTYTGTYTYTDDSQGRPGGAPVTVFQEGRANGTVTLTFDTAGQALMHLKELKHTFRSWVDPRYKGQDQGVPEIELDFVWEVGGAC
jgi:hypothetical protein